MCRFEFSFSECLWATTCGNVVFYINSKSLGCTVLKVFHHMMKNCSSLKPWPDSTLGWVFGTVGILFISFDCFCTIDYRQSGWDFLLSCSYFVQGKIPEEVIPFFHSPIFNNLSVCFCFEKHLGWLKRRKHPLKHCFMTFYFFNRAIAEISANHSSSVE